MQKGKFAIRLLLSLAVSGALIYLSLRHTDLRAVWHAIAGANPWPILAYAAILLVIHVVKTVRWWLLLEPLGKVGFWRVNAASAVGFMLLVTLPLRLGELARPLLVSRPTEGDDVALPRSGALASCVVERIVDCLAMGILATIALRFLAASGHSAEVAQHAATLVTIGFGALCVGLACAFFARERTVALVRRVGNMVSPRVGHAAVKLVDGFIRGLHLGSARRVLAFLGLTALYWALHVIGFQLTALAFGIRLSPLMACTVLACQVVGIMIPAGPGMVGTSQFFTQLGVSIFVSGVFDSGAVASQVAAYANAIWFLQFGQQLLTGLPYLLLGRVSTAGLFSPPPPDALPLAAENG